MSNPDDILHIVVADTSDIVRQGTAAILASLTGLRVTIHEASSPRQLSDMLASNIIEIVIVAPQLGDATNWRKEWPATRFVALISSAVDSQTISQYDDHFSITDNATVIGAKISTLQHMSTNPTPEVEPLSQREKEVVVCAVKGMTNREISTHLGLSIHTIVTHRRNINFKLKVHNTTSLMIAALKQGIVTLNDLPDLPAPSGSTCGSR